MTRSEKTKGTGSPSHAKRATALVLAAIAAAAGIGSAMIWSRYCHWEPVEFRTYSCGPAEVICGFLMLFFNLIQVLPCLAMQMLAYGCVGFSLAISARAEPPLYLCWAFYLATVASTLFFFFRILSYLLS